MKRNAKVALLGLLALGLLQGTSDDCGPTAPVILDVDVGGPGGADWTVTYGDRTQVRVFQAGALLSSHDLPATGGSFVVDGATVDLSATCGRSDVACPKEVFPASVRVVQRSSMTRFNVGFSRAGPLSKLEGTLEGLIDQVNIFSVFSVALNVGGAASGGCGLRGLSSARGWLGPAESSPPFTSTEMSGRVVTTYAGSCLAGGSTGANLTVELTVSFTARRKN